MKYLLKLGCLEASWLDCRAEYGRSFCPSCDEADSVIGNFWSMIGKSIGKAGMARALVNLRHHGGSFSLSLSEQNKFSWIDFWIRLSAQTDSTSLFGEES